MNKIIPLMFVGAVLLTACVPANNNNTNNTNQTAEVDFFDFNNNQSDTMEPTETNPANVSAPTGGSIIATKAIIQTSLGDITVEFYPESPKTVNNFINLAKADFYDGTRFHRVIADFMIQAGDPLSRDQSKKQLWGTGGPDYVFADEINSHKLVKGSLAMANRGADTNGSQFFIVTADATPWLDGKHTNFGYVVDGMDVVEAIGNLNTDASDKPLNEVIVEDIVIQ